MPDRSERPGASLPPRPSLEQLRKQAKEKLKALRRENPETKLSAAHHALAREYGFENWRSLSAAVASINPSGLRDYEKLADEIAAAYTRADADAIREINWRLGTAFAHFPSQPRMHRQLPAWAASAERRFETAQTDARRLIARYLGFEEWEHLAASLRPSPIKAGPAPVREGAYYRIDRARKLLCAHGMLSAKHWREVASVMKAEQLTALHGSPDDDAMEALSRVDELTELHVEGPLGDRGMRAVSRMRRLENFIGGGPRSPVTDKGLEALFQVKTLRRVAFCWAPQISDKGVFGLESCDRLESVDFLGAPVGDGLIAAMAGKQNLRVLKAGRLTTDAGLRLLQRIPPFVDGPDINANVSLMTLEVEPHLLLDGPITDAGLAVLSRLQGLRGVSFFWHARQLTPAGLRVLDSLPRLRFVGCEGGLCDDAAMRRIAALPKLQMLMAQGAVATDAGFKALSKSQTLESLWGRECPNLSGPGFMALANAPRLHSLGVSCARVEDSALATLPSFPALRWLMPMDIGDEGFRHVGKSVGLEHLTCMYCPTAGDTASERLLNLHNLRRYYSSQPLITDKSLETLSKIRSLETIELSRTQEVTDAGVMRLAALPALRAVSLKGLPKVTRAAAAAFRPDVDVVLRS